jgi:hypothetical protein
VFSHDNDSGKPFYEGLNVTCSPDGERQKVASLKSGKSIVCKHGAAALELVLDKDAAEARNQGAKRRKTEQDARKVRQEDEETKQRQTQEEEMPGERARLEYGSNALGSVQVVKLIKKSMGTVAGLRTVATPFPVAAMPVPSTKYCVRCEETYDERFLSQRLCQIPHPADQCHTDRDKHRFWEHCEKCDKTFKNVTGEYNFGKDRIFEEGKWCFEGEHVSDENVVVLD